MIQRHTLAGRTLFTSHARRLRIVACSLALVAIQSGCGDNGGSANSNGGTQAAGAVAGASGASAGSQASGGVGASAGAGGSGAMPPAGAAGDTAVGGSGGVAGSAGASGSDTSGGTAGSGASAGFGGMTMTGEVPPINAGGGTLKLEVCAEDVIRVLFATDTTFFTRTSLAAAPKRCDGATAWQLVDEAGMTVLRTARLELRIEPDSGRISFFDRDGNLILAEKAGGGRTLEPQTIQDEATNHVRQEWEPEATEALYGLGNYQLGVLDIKGYDVELSQYNTNAVVPTLVSSRGYGIFWDNTSYTRFGDLREYEPVPGFTYDGAGNVNGATSGSVDVTVEVTAQVTGDYIFKTFAGGDIKLSVDGALVIEHWRQGWLPDEEVARVRLTAGQTVPVRLQWTADIGVNTLNVSWKTPSEAVAPTSLWSHVGDGIDYYFMYGPELDRVVSGYRRVTGQASMLPRWTFGLFQSRERYPSAAELTAAVDGYRSRGIPLDVIVQDWQYWPDQQWGSHEFDSTRFPDPAGFIDSLHAKNVKFMISVWPKFYTNTANYAALQAAGLMYPYEQGVVDFLGEPFAFYDAFNPDGRALYWQQIEEQLFGFGVDAWWLDATEPETVEGPYTSLAQGRELYQTHMHPTAAGTGSRVLNAYSLVNSQGIYEGQRTSAPTQRVFILTRSAFGGQQRYASATWSGDISSTWQSFKKQIPGGLGFSVSGIPYWTVDSGGFAVPPRYAEGQNASEWQELNARWFEYATFLPLLRVHGQAPAREMWEFGGDTSAAYAAMLKFDRLRYRLLPYVYSLASAATHRDGTLLRPLVMDFRTDAAALGVEDQFMFGPALLVSPVTDYQARSRSVYLPATPGNWYDFWTGEVVSGGASVTADAPLDVIPVHVRPGSLVPFGPELSYTSEKPADPITLFVYAGRDGSFELFEDDGESYGYETGEFSRIPLSWNDATSTLTIGAREGSFPGMLASRTFEIVLVRAGKAVPFSFTPTSDASATYDGTALDVVIP
jgi:alpha-D-xyloside xylohydrolase